ncbi:MAG: OmpA family protein [Cytophagales bacterium]
MTHDILLLIGKGYHLGNHFEDAAIYYEKYKQSVLKGETKDPKNSKEKVLAKIEQKLIECKVGREIYEHPVNFELNNISNTINTEYPEYAPVITPDEKIIYFTSRRPGSTGNKKDRDNEFFEDIYYSENIDGVWTKAKNIGAPINTEFHDGCIGISADGNELFIFRDINGGDIYSSIKNEKGEWSVPQSLGSNINSKYYEPSVCMSKDRKMLFFSSNRPGGVGGLDIYMSLADEKGKWGKPKILGNEINTPFNEESPYFDDETKTLYFSSSGHKGMGGYDIYKTTYDSASLKWNEPINLGYPINTTDDDIYYSVSSGGLRGYYASIRDYGVGEKDIYVVDIPKEQKKTMMLAKNSSKVLDETVEESVQTPTSRLLVSSNKSKTVEEVVNENSKNTTINNSNNTNNNAVNIKNPNVVKTSTESTAPKTAKVSGMVLDSKKGTPVQANVQLVDSKGKVIKSVNSSGGYFSIEVPLPNANSNYSVSVTANGYMYKSRSIQMSPNKSDYQADISVNALEIGFKTVLRNIYFGFNSADIKPESISELQKLEKLLRDNPNIKVKISGHTDNVGKAETNKILSQKRVDAVVNYLANKGIDRNRMIGVGYGLEKPLASNDDEIEGRELNRRTEFEVIEK